MRRRISKPDVKELILAAVLIIALAVGIAVPGGTGDTIVACAGVAIALVLIFKFGILPTPPSRRPPGRDERHMAEDEFLDPPRPGERY